MLTPEESAELRGLQRRAYGPDAGLPAEDAARLHALEALRVQRQAPPPAPEQAASESETPEDAPRSAAHAEESAEDGPSDAGEPGSVQETGDTPAARPARPARALRPRWLPIALTGAALLAGVGIGALATGDAIPSLVLATAHAAQRADLESTADFDPGSLIPMAEEHGAVIWRATRNNNEWQCILLTVEDRSEHQCASTESLENDGIWSLNTSIPLPIGSDGVSETMNAGLLRDVRGEVTAFTQLWSEDSWDWRSQFTEDEQVILDRLEDEGFTGQTLQIVGYDGATPVWLDYSAGLCVVVSTPDRTDQACSEDGQQSVRLTVSAEEGSRDYVVTETEMRGPVLTIERAATVEESAGSDAE